MQLYYHKTSGGAAYLTDTFISWKHNGKSGKEGIITSLKRHNHRFYLLDNGNVIDSDGDIRYIAPV